MSLKEPKPGDAFMYNGHMFRGHMFIYVKDIDLDPVFFDTIDAKVYRVNILNYRTLITKRVPHPNERINFLPWFDFMTNIKKEVFEWVKVNAEKYIEENGPLESVTFY